MDGLQKNDAQPGSILTVETVAATSIAKKMLREKTGADAVEMESGIIQAFCKAESIRVLTVRVISDSFDEDLPLDFSKMLRADDTLDPLKLAWAIACHPGKIPSLLKLQSQLKICAATLSMVLVGLLENELRQCLPAR